MTVQLTTGFENIFNAAGLNAVIGNQIKQV